MNVKDRYLAPKWTEADDALLYELRGKRITYPVIRRDYMPERTVRALMSRYSKIIAERDGRSHIPDPLRTQRARAEKVNRKFVARLHACLKNRARLLAQQGKAA